MTLFGEPTVVLAPPTAVFLIRWGSLCAGGVTPGNINQWLWQECGFKAMLLLRLSWVCVGSSSYLPKHLMRPHTTQLVVTNKLLQMDPNSAQNLDTFSWKCSFHWGQSMMTTVHLNKTLQPRICKATASVKIIL